MVLWNMLASKDLITRAFAGFALLQPRHIVNIMQTSVPLHPKDLRAPCLKLISATPVLGGSHSQDFSGSALSERPSPLLSTPTLAFKMPPSIIVAFIFEEVFQGQCHLQPTHSVVPLSWSNQSLPSSLASQPANTIFSGPPCLWEPCAGCVCFLRQQLFCSI